MTSSVVSIQIRSLGSYAGIAEASAPTSRAAFFSSAATLLRRLRWRSAWAELSCQKSFDKVPSFLVPDTPTTETNNVHVIVLDPLPSREVIIDQSGTDSPNFVGAD